MTISRRNWCRRPETCSSTVTDWPSEAGGWTLATALVTTIVAASVEAMIKTGSRPAD